MSKENPLPKNVFYDISKFPKSYGLLVFPISISRIDHDRGQSPKQCLEFIGHFSPQKITEPKVGLNVVYGDSLYMNSSEPAGLLKDKYTNMVLRHQSGFQNLIRKNWERFQIEQAFSFQIWGQMYLNYKGGNLFEDIQKLHKLYEGDLYFQDLVKQDAEYCKRELTQDQLNFFLEEFLVTYLLTKKQITMPNEYVQGRESWILNAYPGPQLKGQIYVYQKNPLNLEAPENIYQNCTYDLEAKKLIDFTRIDLNTYNYQYE